MNKKNTQCRTYCWIYILRYLSLALYSMGERAVSPLALHRLRFTESYPLVYCFSNRHMRRQATILVARSCCHREARKKATPRRVGVTTQCWLDLAVLARPRGVGVS